MEGTRIVFSRSIVSEHNCKLRPRGRVENPPRLRSSTLDQTTRGAYASWSLIYAGSPFSHRDRPLLLYSVQGLICCHETSGKDICGTEFLNGGLVYHALDFKLDHLLPVCKPQRLMSVSCTTASRSLLVADNSFVIDMRVQPQLHIIGPPLLIA